MIQNDRGIKVLLYDKIYQTAQKNMISAGLQFSFNKKVFESILYKNSDFISIKEFDDFTDEKDFVAAVYLRFLNRLPDEKAKKRYDGLILKKQVDIANYIFYSALIKSVEFKKLNKTIIDLKDLKKELYKKGVWYVGLIAQREEIKGIIWKILLSYPFKIIWHYLPNCIKNIICIKLGWR